MSDDDSIVILNFDSEMSMPSVTAGNNKTLDDVDANEDVADTYSIINLESKDSKCSNSSLNTNNSGSISSIQHSISINNPSSLVKSSLAKENDSNATQRNKDNSNLVRNLLSTEIDSECNSKESVPDFKLNGNCTEGSLAADFLTGETEKESLEKASILTHFPSIANSLVSNEEITKLQSFFSNYVKLIDTVQKNTDITKGYFSSIQKWRNEAQSHKEEQVKHVKTLEDTIAKLTNENLELKKEIRLQMQNIKVVESVMKEENTEIIKQLSEKAAHIEIMKNQIETLEQHQLGSYEFIKRKNDDEGTEYTTTAEHKRVIKNFERQLSILKAQNLEFEDMKNVYIDEINCLKVQLTASEELLLQARADIKLLQNSDLEKSTFFQQYVTERDEMKEQIKLLKAQIDLYANDFKMEKTAKELISNERDAILSDLRLLQERNQKLVEEAQEMYDKEQLSKTTSSSTSIFKRNDETGTKPKTPHRAQNTVETFMCPICAAKFTDYRRLETHVDICVEKNK